MISRKTALLIGEAYAAQFRYPTYLHGRTSYRPKPEEFYLFLFERGYDAWFCNLARKGRHGERAILEYVATLHTGESIASATKDWTQKSREKLGQQLLRRMAEDYLNTWNSTWLPEESEYGGKDDVPNSVESWVGDPGWIRD